MSDFMAEELVKYNFTAEVILQRGKKAKAGKDTVCKAKRHGSADASSWAMRFLRGELRTSVTQAN